MEAIDYFSYLVNEIHTVVAATVDDEGLPVTAAIDLMDCDEKGLYFLTAKGKGFYSRLTKRPFLAFTGLKGADTMSSAAVSVRGRVKNLGPGPVPALFEKNKYMYEIYPREESRGALEAFWLYEGTGEWFDLSKKPVERASFVFGEAKRAETGYFITDQCTGCRQCTLKCPQKCIDTGVRPAVIRQANCLRCGNCYEVCPIGAVEKRG